MKSKYLMILGVTIFTFVFLANNTCAQDSSHELGGLPAIGASILLYDGPRLLTAPPSLNAALLALKHLVGLEEVLDLLEPVLRKIADVLYFVELVIIYGNGQNLLVDTLLVPHPQDTDWPDLNMAAREGRLFNDDQDVQWIPVSRLCARYESIVRGVVNRREEHSVKPNSPCLLVYFILVPAAPGNLYNSLSHPIASN